MLSPQQYFQCFYWLCRPELREQGDGVPVGCVWSVSSHRGSSRHLSPYSSRPDLYPQTSLAQQAHCLISSKRLPAGGHVVRGSWGDKGREELRGAPQRGPLTWSLARQGRQPRQTASCLLPASSSSLLSATQTPGVTERQTREWWGERERERRAAWWGSCVSVHFNI